jgi:hypothetical protein
MRRTITITAVLLLAAGTAAAQPLTLDPAGRPAETPPPTPPAGDTGAGAGGVYAPAGVTPSGAADGTEAGVGAEGGYYHMDGYDLGVDDDEVIPINYGPVPETHTVRRGDTLWDICWYYFNNPWEWPKVWSYNTSITNPHWIYPGDQVRLYPKGLGPSAALTPTGPEVEPEDGPIAPAPVRDFGVSLHQMAFVDQEKLNDAGTVAGSVEEKSLLSEGDAIYIDYEGKKAPKVGKRYTIYTEDKQVKHPGKKDAKVVGSYVRIIGEVEIVSVKKGKKARAVITDSVDVIERGARVGPLEKQLRVVDAVANEVNVQGTIVAMLDADQLIGTGQVVFLDLGKADGVKVGNRLYVVRRGDAYDDVMGPKSNIGQDDRRFPARALGEVMVVQIGKHAAVALVTLAIQEMGPGDLVLMRKSE